MRVKVLSKQRLGPGISIKQTLSGFNSEYQVSAWSHFFLRNHPWVLCALSLYQGFLTLLLPSAYSFAKYLKFAAINLLKRIFNDYSMSARWI